MNEKKGADNFKYEFTELNVAKMMHNDNQSKFYKQLYQTQSVQNIIDLQFRDSKTFFLWLSFIYIVAFVVPYILYATMANFGLSSRNTTPLIAVCSLGQVLFTLIEITYLY